MLPDRYNECHKRAIILVVKQLGSPACASVQCSQPGDQSRQTRYDEQQNARFFKYTQMRRKMNASVGDTAINQRLFHKVTPPHGPTYRNPRFNCALQNI